MPSKKLANDEAADVPRPLPVTLTNIASFFPLYSPVCLLPSVITYFTLRLQVFEVGWKFFCPLVCRMGSSWSPPAALPGASLEHLWAHRLYPA